MSQRWVPSFPKVARHFLQIPKEQRFIHCRQLRDAQEVDCSLIEGLEVGVVEQSLAYCFNVGVQLSKL